MVAYTTRMPIGFPGRISREDSLTVETAMVDPNTPPTLYGKFVKFVAGLIQPVVSGTTWDALIVAPFPTQNTLLSAQSVQGLGNTVAPPTSGPVDILRRGYLTVQVARGTPVAGGVVALRVTAGAYTAGDIEGDGTNVSGGGGDNNCIKITNAYWTGPKDANGVAEMAFNI